ncbi:hypothetical protein [Sphingobium aromaticiconvertens]|uniref:hypothetical protein n=1 Tax=Sphingobium aromaticiconvertens TaxID=365341 RepID=UPI00301662A2
MRLRPGRLVAAAWALCSAVMLWIFHGSFVALGFRDPDDAMRLTQVRDWIGGQSWFDVTQYRVYPPAGGPMHWSRIVDLPIADIILTFRPFLGMAGAEILACIIVPLLLLGALTWATYRAAGRIGGTAVALVSVALLLTNPSILVQFTPMRIDHHGWQILMAAVALGGLFDPRAARGGMVAGLALAVWLQISSEGLPYAALFAGVLALQQWMERREARRFVTYAVTLGIAALALLMATRGASALWAQNCDALSYIYIWPLLGLSVASLIAVRLIGNATPARRFAVPAIGGLCAVAIFLVTGGSCLSGDPFAALGPLAYRYWYLQVMEGRPIWEQGLSMAGVILLTPVIGLVGTLGAAGANRDGARRDWLMLALLLGGTMAVSILVMRAMSVAHLFALPGIAWLLITLFRRVQASRMAMVRVFGSVALAALTPFGLAALWVSIATKPDAKTEATNTTDCREAATLAPLKALSPALLFAPIDMGPDILVQTRHAVTGTAHHRNAAGITAVLEGYMAPPAKAQQVIERLNGGGGAAYVITCSGLNEMGMYVKDSPHGLAAVLARGEVPAWLTQLPTHGPLKIYRVLPATKRIATPFMQ